MNTTYPSEKLEPAPTDNAAPLEAAPAQPSPILVAETVRRDESIDVIRLIAAAGIVFVHAVKTPTLVAAGNFFRFAVPFYLFASLYYQSRSLRKHPDRPLGSYIISRFRRLYLPFLAWTVIYLLARDIKRITLLHLPPVMLESGMLWKGVEYHLWFLPFLLAWSIVLAVLYASLIRQDRRWRWPISLIAIAAGLAVALLPMPASWDELFDNPTYAYVQFWRATPAACWALAFALLVTAGPVIYRVSTSLGVAGIALAVVCSVWQIFRGIVLIPRGLSGFGSMLAALMPWRITPAVALLAKYGRYAYGIYLCHVLVIEFVRVFVSRAHLSTSPAADLLMFVLSFGGSIALVAALAKSRKTAWLNG